jgi:hypothetical protein
LVVTTPGVFFVDDTESELVACFPVVPDVPGESEFPAFLLGEVAKSPANVGALLLGNPSTAFGVDGCGDDIIFDADVGRLALCTAGVAEGT